MPIMEGRETLFGLGSRPLDTRVASWVAAKVLRQLHRQKVLLNLQAVYGALTAAGQQKLIEIIEKEETGLLQVYAHPELFSAGRLIDFTWLREKHLARLLSAAVLGIISQEFGEIDGLGLVVVGGRLNVVHTSVGLPAVASQTLPVITPHDLETAAGQKSFLLRVLERSPLPLKREELVSLTLKEAENLCSALHRLERRRILRSLREASHGILVELQGHRNVILTVDGRYLGISRLTPMVEQGTVFSLYVEGEEREYVSTVGLEEVMLVEIQAGSERKLVKLDYVAQLETAGRVKVVHDVEGRTPVGCYYTVATFDALASRGEILRGRAGGENEFYVARRARAAYWKEIYQYQAFCLLKVFQQQHELPPDEVRALMLALGEIFTFVFGVRGEEAFALLERAARVAAIGGTPEEIMASLLAGASRPALQRFLAASAKRIPEAYRVKLLPVVEKFHLLSQVPFKLKQDDPRWLQWYLRFFVAQTKKLPVLKLLVADLLVKLEQGVPVDRDQVEMVYLHLLDKTVEIAAAAALKDALFWREHPAEAQQVREKLCASYGMPYSQLGPTLQQVAHALEEELTQLLSEGFFGEEFKDMRLMVLYRKKSDASVYEKIFLRRIYDDIDGLWDGWGMQVVVESRALAEKVARYIAGKYGVNKKVFDETGRSQRLSPAECEPAGLLREGDVKGASGERIEFFKVGAIVCTGHKDCKVEIQIHERQMFVRYKKGVSGTAIYNLQKKRKGLEFEPEPLVDPMLSFEEQIAAMVGVVPRSECLIAGVDLDAEGRRAFVRGEVEGLVRSVMPGTRVAELAFGQGVELPNGYGAAEVYRYALADDWTLKLVPVQDLSRADKRKTLVDATVEPAYIVQPGDIIVFRSLPHPDEGAQTSLAHLMTKEAVNPFARLAFIKQLMGDQEFREALWAGYEIVAAYLHRPTDAAVLLEKIALREGFRNFEDFVAAIGFGYFTRNEVKAVVEKHLISLRLDVEPRDTKVFSYSCPDAFGLLRYLLDTVMASPVRIIGGVAYTVQEAGLARAEGTLTLSGGLTLQEDLQRRLNDFIHAQGVVSFRPEARFYTIFLRKVGQDWDNFRHLVSFLERQRINIFEYDIGENASTGYVKVELPPEMHGVQFTRILLESPEVDTDEHTVVSL